MKLPKDIIYQGQINGRDIRAKLVLYRNQYDARDTYRWYWAYHYWKDISGQTIENLDKSRGQGFSLQPNPYQSLPLEQAIQSATCFIKGFGFALV